MDTEDIDRFVVLVMLCGILLFGIFIGVLFPCGCDERWQKELVEKGYAEYKLDSKTGEVEWSFKDQGISISQGITVNEESSINNGRVIIMDGNGELRWK